MSQTENYLQRAWSDGIDNVNIHDVKTALNELKEMDDEHGVIWVSVLNGEENIIEVHKDLSIIVDFDNHEIITTNLNNWQEVIELYQLLLDKKFDEIIKKIR